MLWYKSLQQNNTVINLDDDSIRFLNDFMTWYDRITPLYTLKIMLRTLLVNAKFYLRLYFLWYYKFFFAASTGGYEICNHRELILGNTAREAEGRNSYSWKTKENETVIVITSGFSLRNVANTDSLAVIHRREVSRRVPPQTRFLSHLLGDKTTSRINEKLWNLMTIFAVRRRKKYETYLIFTIFFRRHSYPKTQLLKEFVRSSKHFQNWIKNSIDWFIASFQY